MKKFRFWLVSVLALLILLPLFLPGAIAAPSESSVFFNDRSFSGTWQRPDKPVKEVPGIGRGYTWGPTVKAAKNTEIEIYNGLPRKVQYFDKARMEVNGAANGSNDPYYVTTGLLVKELVTGLRQDGDNSFTPLKPSTVQIAGDSNLGGGNTIAPTYASFAGLVTFNGSENGKPAAIGSKIVTALDKSGAVREVDSPERRYYKTYDPVTAHNIADVFVDFGNKSGPVWNGKELKPAPLYTPNPTYVFGRPVSEAYWIRAVCAGVEKDVLVQLFERRVLTYTPSNPAAFQVEMGNVGQHYFIWRYIQNGNGPAPLVSSAAVNKSVKIDFTGSGTVQDQVFYSRSLGKDEIYRIYLPPGYAAANQRYPVLYMLHGRFASYQQWTENGLLDQAEALITAKKIRSMIIVMPDGENSYWMNQANNGPRWADYVAIDLVTQIDANFRTQATVAGRAIGGLSMGGHGALQIGINYPGVFNIIGAHSPALRTKEQAFDFFGNADYYATIDPVTLAQTYDLSGYKLWLDIGQDDKDWVQRATEMDRVLTERGFAHQWHLWPGGHNLDYWRAHVADYLAFYSEALGG